MIQKSSTLILLKSNLAEWNQINELSDIFWVIQRTSVTVTPVAVTPVTVTIAVFFSPKKDILILKIIRFCDNRLE